MLVKILFSTCRFEKTTRRRRRRDLVLTSSSSSSSSSRLSSPDALRAGGGGTHSPCLSAFSILKAASRFASFFDLPTPTTDVTRTVGLQQITIRGMSYRISIRWKAIPNAIPVSPALGQLNSNSAD